MNHPTRRNATRVPLLATAIACAFVTNLAAAPGHAPRADTDRFIVKFRNSSAEHGNAAKRQRKLDEIGNKQGLHLGQLRRLAIGADVIKSDRQLTADEAKALIGQLRADPRVEYAEIDAKKFPDFTPNDTYFPLQWHYTSATAGINLPTAWDTTSGAGEVVAVLDTGYVAHPDLVANILPGYDFIDDAFVANDGDGRDANPIDPGDWNTAGQCGTGSAARASSWHGTHTAGTIAAVTNNASGVAGVAYGAKVQPLRVLGRCGGYTSDIADAIVWASGGSVPGIPDNTTPATAMNLSLSGPGSCDPVSQAAIDIAVANGTTIMVSAGNQNIDTAGRSPASCNNVVNVGASNKLSARASYSNFGPLVDIAAPGGESGTNGVVSTYAAGSTTLTGYNYAYLAGTSMASPHAAGTGALIQAAAGGGRTPAEVEAILKGTSRPLTVACPQGCGEGLIDAAAAVAVAGTPFLYLTDVTPVAEGNSGTQAVTFTVNLSQPLASDVTFDIATVDGTATEASGDYVARSETGMVIPAGATSASFDVTVNGDQDLEVSEVFSVAVSNVSGATVMDGDADAMINNDDLVHLANAVPVGNLAFGYSLYFDLPVPANASNLKFQITGGPGTSGDADLYVKFGSIPTLASYDCRPYLTGNNETCTMPAATQGTWYGLLDAYAPYTDVTLVGSYEVPVDLSIDDASVSEGDSGTKVVTFTVSLSQPTAVTTTFDLATADGTAIDGSDYYANSATTEFIDAGATTKTFQVNVIGDTDIEADEDFLVNLTNASANGTITDGQGTGTITNDDFPSLSIDDQSSDEGDSGTTQQTFTASLDQAAPFDVTFDVATSGGSATADDDFASNSATGVTIAAGNTSATFSVDINGDTAIEGDESYTVDLSNVANATVADGSGTGTINNDDYPTLSISDATAVTEGNAGTTTMTFTVSLDAVAAKPVTFDVATSNGSALAGSDYVAGSATGEVIPAGQLSKTFSVTVNGDGAMERDELLYAVVSNVTEANLGDALGAGTITNDDGTISVSDPVAVFEGDTGTKMLNFTVTLSQASTQDVTFTAKTQTNNGGTATAGVDYTAINLASVVVPAGQTSKVVGVPIIGDTTVEPDETVRLNVGSNSVIVANGKAFGTIANDDGVKLSIADAGFLEGDSGTRTLNFTVSLSQASTLPVTFNIFTVNGMAVAGEDYVAKSLTGVTIPAGQTSYTFALTTNGDTKIEGNETLFVRVGNANVAVLDGQARGVLVNDDGPVLSISDATVTEGDAGTKLMTFTVSLSKLATAKVTFNFSTAAATATAGSDFDPVSVTGLVIPYGQLSRTVSVVIRGDTTVEPDETLRGNISMGNVSIMDGVGIGTITNDDVP